MTRIPRVLCPALAAGLLALPAAARDSSPGPAAALQLAAHAVRAPAPEVDASRLGEMGLRASVEAFYAEAVGSGAGARATEDAADALAELSPSYRAGLAIVLDAMAQAQRLRDRAYAGVGSDEIGFVERVALGSMFAPESVAAADAARAAAILSRIDVGSMLRGAALVHAALDRARPLFAAEDAPEDPVVTTFDAIVVGTAGADVYRRDKQLVVDPGGDDVYLNNAGGLLSAQVFDTTGGCVYGGGTTGKAPPNLECTPAPSQVCTYDIVNNAIGTEDLPDVSLPNHDPIGTGGGRDGSCGSDERRRRLAADTADIGNDGDSRAVAALLDLGGSDTYSVEWTHHDPLFDLIEFCYPGDESTTNTNRDLFQGGSLAGISILWDDGPGSNTFRGRLNAQGSGHVGGVGMLISTGDSDDAYWADRLSQGNGIAGGVGVLYDDGGANSYLLEPPVVYRNEFRPSGRECSQEGRAGQGQGGFGGAGILWNEGPAVFRAVTHAVEVQAPYAPVLDGNGLPVLVRGTDAQGSGESFPIPGSPGGLVVGVGVLVDVGGAETVCGGAGKVSGATHSTQSPGIVDASCGRYNVPAEIGAGDLPAAFAHLAGGAVGLRVVVSP